MSERVQLLLSDLILGMTLVPEGRVWNYGIGLTQLWSPNIPYSITLDTPLLFWAEEHRPAAFLTVSSGSYLPLRMPLTRSCRSSQILNRVRTRLMLKIASSDRRYLHDPTLSLASCIFCCILNPYLIISPVLQSVSVLTDLQQTRNGFRRMMTQRARPTHARGRFWESPTKMFRFQVTDYEFGGW
jgi:PROCT (NUC072) domain